MKKIIYFFLCIPVLGFSIQEDPLPTELTIKYFQKGDNIELNALLQDEDGEPVSDMVVHFTASVNENKIDLGNLKTNAEGVAVLEKEISTLRTLGHVFYFEATFEGTDAYDGSSAEREIHDAKLLLGAETIDSVNTVVIQLMSWNDQGEEIPVSETEVYFFVPRMFSRLPIGESYTDDGGEDQFEFPTDLPGGSTGKLAVIGKIDEHEDMGTIETTIEVPWGIPVLQEGKNSRALWSPDAPMWMLITFIILMTGAWFHYFLIIFKLFQIKKIGSSEDKIIYTE